MKLCEIRVSVDYVEPYEGNRIELIGRAISMIFLKNLGKYDINGTNVLLIHFRSDINFKPTDELFNLGCKLNSNIGSVIVFFDNIYFQSCATEKKQQYLLERINYATLKYAEKFNLEKEPIEKAFERTKTSNLLVRNSKVFKTKDKKYQSELFIKVNYETKEYWLQITKIKEKKAELFFICQKENFFGVEHPERTIHDLLEIPQTMKIEGWDDDNNFHLLWGKEKYMFDINKKVVVKSPADTHF